ncbi:hypothetical protein ANN_15988 [Periplaneta americana]|uniref:Uncharacterized protein n=1 Tax=Periplaneta americana TaxID=6978 RepID=A0ABQ8SHV3_PERAM|nr:hypothetical protein ANN_15988 [Periplaneta americana]
MAGLCEDGSEPPGSLKVIREVQVALLLQDSTGLGRVIPVWYVYNGGPSERYDPRVPDMVESSHFFEPLCVLVYERGAMETSAVHHTRSQNLELQTFRDDPLHFEHRSPNYGPLHSNSGLQTPQLRTQLKSRSGLEAGFTATQD